MKGIKLLYGLLICLVTACSPSNDKVCPNKTCADYFTQSEAQAAYDADKDCLGELDNDNDGIACEHLSPGGGSGCPTTNNCGCSNKNKSQCASACCQWIVGTGCRCS